MRANKYDLQLHNTEVNEVVEGAGLVPWVVGLVDAFFVFYLREAFRSQTNTGKIWYNESR